MVDLIVEGQYIVTMDTNRRVLKNGAVIINDGKIIDIGKSDDLKKKYTADRLISGKKYLVLPGLIDVHTHVFQCLCRGLGDDMPVEEWGAKSLGPVSKVLTRSDFYWAAKLNALEMIKSGTTTFVDSHFLNTDKKAIDGVVDGTIESGLRARIVRSSQNRTRVGETEDLTTAKRETLRVFNKYNGQDNRISIAPEAVSPLRSDDEFLLGMKQLADEFGNGFYLHIAESLNRYKAMKSLTGMGEIGYLHKMGILDHSVLMAHVIWVPTREILLIKKNDAKVAHNPVSNSYLADGYADIPLMRALGITIGLGCDGASSNNTQDILRTANLCALRYKAHTLDASVLTAEDILEMLTIEGAKAIGLADQIGSLELGKRADITVVDLGKPHLTPAPRPISNLIYSANGSDVVTTIVNGNILMDNRNVTTLDEQDILDNIEKITLEMIDKSDLHALVQKGNFRFS